MRIGLVMRSDTSPALKNELQRDHVPFRLVVFQSFANMAPGAVVGVFITGLAGIALGSMPLVAVGAFLIFFLTLNANYQFSKKIVNAGGYFGYAGHAINKTAGFYAGMFYAINGIIGGAAFGFLQFAVFAYFLFPSLSSVPYLWLLFMTGDAIFVTGITYRGLRPNLLYVTITGIFESAILYIGALALIAYAGPHNTTSVFTLTYVGGKYNLLFLAIIANFTSFIGAGSVITLGEEAKNPSSTIKKALVWVIFIGAIPIILSSYAFTVAYGPLNMGTFANLSDPGFLLYMQYLGPVFAYIFAFIVLNSCLSVGVAIYNATSRTLWAMAREGLLPKSLSHVHPKFKTPSRVILLLAVIDYIIAVAAVAAFGVFDGFFVLAVSVAIPVMLAHLIANVGLPIFSVKQKVKIRGLRLATNYIAPIVTVVVVIAAIIVATYPVPTWPYTMAPITALSWTVIITGIVFYHNRKNKSLLQGKPANILESSEEEVSKV